MPTKDTVVVSARIPDWLRGALDDFAGHHKITRSQAIITIIKGRFGYK